MLQLQALAYSGIINCIVSLVLGFLVIIKEKKNVSNRLFFLMTIALGVWGIGYWQWLIASEKETALFWIRVFSSGSLFIPILFFHWVTVLTNTSLVHKRTTMFGYAVTTSLALFLFSDKFVAGTRPEIYFPFWPVPGPFYHIYLAVLYGVLVTVAIALLVKSYLSASLAAKGQFFFVLLGAVFGFGGGLTNFFLWYQIPIPPYGNFLVAIFPFLLGYSIITHGLFNIKTIATEILVFALSTILLIQTAFSTSLLEGIWRGFLFLVTSFFGYLLIRSVYNEVATRKKIERLAFDLERANIRLRELDRQKTEFVSIATHQLRSPLTAIKGYSSMMIEGSFGKLNDILCDAVQKIYKSSETLVTVIENYLHISRLEQGRMAYLSESCDVKELMLSTHDQLLPNAKSRNIAIDITYDEDGTYRVRGDKEKLRQVFINLIDNAIKYTKDGKIGISLIQKPLTVEFSVSDTGIGMARDTIDHLFEKFRRAKDAGDYHATGAGLGLYLAAEIVRAHRGRISASSPGKGKGSIFRVELPKE